MKKMSAVFVVLLSFVILAIAQDGRRTSARERWAKDELVTLKGEIIKVVPPLATLKADGKEYTMHLGPEWYWRENDYKLEAGAVEVRGEVATEEGELHFYPYAIVQGKNTITLVAEEGTPLWSKGSNKMMKGMHHGSGGNKCEHGAGGQKCEHGCCGTRQ